MNTASKILTLCVVILVLVGSVLMYMRHVSQPPVSMEYYTEALLDLDSLGQNGWTNPVWRLPIVSLRLLLIE